MAAITLRNLPRGVARAIREKARRERLSLNKAVIGLLEEATGAAPRGTGMPGVDHDLDRFFGAWTEEEADAFDKALREQRSVDLEMWR